MSATVERPRESATTAAIAGSRRAPADLPVIGVLTVLLALVAAVTWRKWGSPEIDPGAELTTADLTSNGSLPYRDVRYFYGPAGLYSLAAAFKIFGTSYTVAFAFGFAQTVAILGTFYALARRWLDPAVSGVATAIMIPIAFSGTASDFVLPHTNSATFGLLFLLASLLALAHDRFVLAGLAAGVVGLTRPEFAAFEAAVIAAFVLGHAKAVGVRGAWRAAWRIVVPAIVLAGAALGSLAAWVGPARLFTENLWPVAFLRQAGFQSQAHWMPFDVASGVGLLARGATYGAAVAVLLVACVQWRRNRPLHAVAALVGAVVGVVLIDVLWRTSGLAGRARAEVEIEARHLILGMSALPAVSLAAAGWVGWHFVRGRRSPLGGAWGIDLALTAAAAVLGLRAYNAFTPEGSYAPYYAAPLVLILAIVHDRAGRRWPSARPAALGALGAVAVGLMAYSLHGLYADKSSAVHTARGTFVTQRAAAGPLQATLDAVRADSGPGTAVFAAPSEGGLYFMADRRPALPELMLLPGLLADEAAEREAVRLLEQADVRTAVIAARQYRAYGPARFGADFDRVVGDWLRSRTQAARVYGTLERPVGGTYPSQGFTVLRLRG